MVMFVYKVILKNHVLRFNTPNLNFFDSVVFNPTDKSPSPNRINDKTKDFLGLKI